MCVTELVAVVLFSAFFFVARRSVCRCTHSREFYNIFVLSSVANDLGTWHRNWQQFRMKGGSAWRQRISYFFSLSYSDFVMRFYRLQSSEQKYRLRFPLSLVIVEYSLAEVNSDLERSQKE